jgi:uncharacterized membrane protein
VSNKTEGEIMQKHKWTNEEISEYRKQHSRIVYFNRLDTRVFVPKAYSFGTTLNWANPIAWVVIAATIALVVCIKIFFINAN